MSVRSTLARPIDAALEATVVGSFSAIGPRLRSRLEGWTDPAPPGSLAGTTALMTGGSSGIGQAAAAALVRAGATVLITGRDADRAQRAADHLRATRAGADVRVHLADLADREQVRRLAEEVGALGRLDLVVHAAGALLHERREAPDGTELTVAAHLLGPHLLTTLLLPHLRAAGGRVVWVSSGGMYAQRLDLEHLELDAGNYDGTTAYARAKRAQVVLVEAWAERLGTDVAVHAMHPGWADTPGVVESLPRFHRLLGPILRTPAEGADTIAWLATAPAEEVGTGAFWLDRRRRSPHHLPWTRGGATPDELWAWCEARLRGVGGGT